MDCSDDGAACLAEILRLGGAELPMAYLDPFWQDDSRTLHHRDRRALLLAKLLAKLQAKAKNTTPLYFVCEEKT